MKKVVHIHRTRCELSLGKVYAELIGTKPGDPVQVVGRPDRIEIYPMRTHLCDICHKPEGDCACHS